jgi:hypothetical protein
MKPNCLPKNTAPTLSNEYLATSVSPGDRGYNVRRVSKDRVACHIHFQPQSKVKCLLSICEFAHSLHESICYPIYGALILQHASQSVDLTNIPPMCCVMFLTVVGEQVRSTAKSDGPISEVEIRLLQRLLYRVDDRDRRWVTSVNLIRCSSHNGAVSWSSMWLAIF